MRMTEKDPYYNKAVDWKMEGSLPIRAILQRGWVRGSVYQTCDLRLLGAPYRQMFMTRWHITTLFLSSASSSTEIMSFSGQFCPCCIRLFAIPDILHSGQDGASSCPQAPWLTNNLKVRTENIFRHMEDKSQGGSTGICSLPVFLLFYKHSQLSCFCEFFGLFHGAQDDLVE